MTTYVESGQWPRARIGSPYSRLCSQFTPIAASGRLTGVLIAITVIKDIEQAWRLIRFIVRFAAHRNTMTIQWRPFVQLH